MSNDAVRKMEDEVRSSWEEGFWKGIEEVDRPIPAWFFEKKLYNLKPWEQGYYIGRQVEKVLR